jgi:DNA excision repair protein ERCC-3
VWDLRRRISLKCSGDSPRSVPLSPPSLKSPEPNYFSATAYFATARSARSQTPLPQSLIRDIQRWTQSYGKLKLVLKRSRYYLESAVPSIIQKLLADEVISSCRAVRVPGDENAAERALAVARGDVGAGVETVARPSRDGLIIPGTKEARKAARLAKGLPEEEPEEEVGDNAAERDAEDDILGAVIGLDRGKSARNIRGFCADTAKRMRWTRKIGFSPLRSTAQRWRYVLPSINLHALTIPGQRVKRQCQIIGLPVLEEYDFRADTINSNLEIDLKPMTVIRPYQETSLSKMFGNGSVGYSRCWEFGS